MIVYRIPPDVRSLTAGNRPLLAIPQGGRIALDATLLALWRHADGQTLDDILATFRAEHATPTAICAALACLAEAGLLAREGVAAPARSQTESATGALVSAVIVSYNSRAWLEECLPSLFVQTYSPLEVIVVDNASTDDSDQWVAAHYRHVKRLRLEQGRSLAYALNRGAEQASGDYLLLLNPDTRLEPDAVAQLVTMAERDTGCGAVAANLRLWWAPAFLNGLGNYVRDSSWGSDNALGHLDLGQFDDWREVPSACFAAMLIPRRAWEEVGPVDEGFPLYYEDSEWCYRARLLGYTVRAAPRAVVYHAFGGRAPAENDPGLTPHKLRCVVYGRWRFTAKIVGPRLARRFARNYAQEEGANVVHALLHGDWGAAGAYLGGWLDFARDLPLIRRERRALRVRARRSDEMLFVPMRETASPLVWRELPELTWDIVCGHYLPLFVAGRTRPMPEFEAYRPRPHLLMVSPDVVDAKMAGPGMRYLEMARALSADVDVTLAVPAETALEVRGLCLVRYWEDRPRSLQVLTENSDVALVSGYMVEKFRFLQSARTRIVVDLYDPFVFENLHYYLNDPLSAQEIASRHAVEISNRLARLGDFFICGSERQRDFWLGLLVANGRVNPHTFAQDDSLRTLIDVVGIGFPDREPRHHPMLRGVHPAFPPNCRIVLWGGGIWNWLDPLTLVRAWPEVIARNPHARLVFLGTRHPNPLVPRHVMADQAEALAAEIGEKDRTIFFHEWLSYEDREALLCEADIGVTLHPMHVETRYAIRTRVLDCVWARLPVLVTDGDVTSEWVRQSGVGRVVSPFDVEAVALALNEMLAQPKESWGSVFTSMRTSLIWPNVVAPLRHYCLHGKYAPDRQERGATALASTAQPGLVTTAIQVWRTQGFRAVARRTWQYLQWRFAGL